MSQKAIVLALLLSVVIGSGYAQQEQQHTTAESQTPPETHKRDEQSTQENSLPQEAVSMAQDGNVSLDFQEADIRSVLQILSMKGDINIVATPEVSGAITIQLKDVPWQEALDVILRTYGYAYEKKGNVIMVTTVEDLKQRRENAMLLAEQEPLVTKTFALNFASAADIIASLEKIKSERGSIDFDARTNKIIVTDIARKMDLISEIIDELDQTTPQVLIEAKIVETVLSDSDKLGIDWTTQATVSGSRRPHTWPFSSTATGANAKYLSGSFPGVDSSTTDNTQFTYGTLNYAQTSAVFEALKTKTDTNILSNPKVITLDNQTAIINIGEERRFVTSVTTNAQTGQTQSSTEQRKIGINFAVTPHVNNAGFVTLDVEPEVSEDTGRTDTVDGNDIPVIGIKTVKTSVMVKGGDTLVIAGLIKSREVEVQKRVPILGDIPGVGYLFRKSEKTLEKTDLLIFITPHIITPEVPGR